MKKCGLMMLVLCLLVTLCGCDTIATQIPTTEPTVPTELPEQPGQFLAGYARADITPEFSVPLAGYGNVTQRMSTNILSRIYTTCLALTDEAGNTVLLITADLIGINATLVSSIRSLITEATGIAAERIMITGSHTHAGPNLPTNTPAMRAYREIVSQAMKKVAVEALNDRLPAQVYTGSIETNRVNFVRHCSYVDSNGQIQYFGNNFGKYTFNSTTDYTTDVDETLHLVQFTREGGKNIVLSNWRAHPSFDSGSKRTDLSADYIGYYRDYLEETLDCNAIFFQGAAGNVNASSNFSSHNRTKDGKEYASILGQYATRCLRENMTQIEPGLIQTSQTVFQGKVDHSTDHLADKAQEVKVVWVNTNDKAEANKVGLPYGIRSPYHASAIITRKGLGETYELELNAITIGNALAIVTAPDELFDTNSAWLEEHSPYAMTLTFGYANGTEGYIPSQIAYDYTCYESDTTKFVPGTGEEIQNTFLQMLNRLAGKE